MSMNDTFEKIIFIWMYGLFNIQQSENILFLEVKTFPHSI